MDSLWSQSGGYCPISQETEHFASFKKRPDSIDPFLDQKYLCFQMTSHRPGSPHLQIERPPASLRELLEAQAQDWSLGSEAIQAALERMGADGVTLRDLEPVLPEDNSSLDEFEVDSQNGRLLLFLYAKGILDNEISEIRVPVFKDLLKPTSDKRKKARTRLLRIVIDGEGTPTRPIMNGTQVSFFQKFVNGHRDEWSENNKDCFVVFRDHPDLCKKGHALKERIQLSGLCYMHGPIIMQHYLVAMNSTGSVPTLDMVKYIRRHFSASKLYDHVWDNKGGSSKAFLLEILVETPEAIISLLPRTLSLASKTLFDIHPVIQEHLHSLGPALVSNFNVHGPFLRATKWQFTGRPQGPSRGEHAMVLVGYRKLENGNFRYLLQNWWLDAPYVEVDLEYLSSAQSILHFIRTKPTEIGPFETNSEDFVESNLDTGECHDLER